MKYLKYSIIPLFILLLSVSVSALDSSPAFRYSLQSDGQTSRQCKTGDIITVTLTLSAQENTAAFNFLALQNELLYDSAFFEPVAGSILTQQEVTASSFLQRDSRYTLHLSLLSYDGGTRLENHTLLATFQLRVIGTAGASTIESRNPIILLADGTKASCTANTVTVTVSKTAQIILNANGGNRVSDRTVTLGDTLVLPEPTRTGYTFTGWFQDIDLTEPWIPSTPIKTNLRLWAGWKKGNASVFTDVTARDWFYEDVACAVRLGYMNGVGSGRFSPNAALTRGMLVTILYRRSGSPAVYGQSVFSDVSSTKYYARAILWATQNGIVKGISATQFKPDAPITREQFATILYRYVAQKETPVLTAGSLSRYTDANRISAYARHSCLWASGVGLLTGFPDGRLCPQGSATRAQSAAILRRLDTLIP